MAKAKNIIGITFNLLTVLKRSENNSEKRAMWICKCICGNQKEVLGKSLRLGVTKSCGCLSRETTSKLMSTHRLSNTTEYRSWAMMKNRCFNKKLADYKRYGGRGITVCERWLNSFENFLDDMGKKPTIHHSLDRYPDTNGNYSPKNCRWATTMQQNRNQRSNVYYEYNGERKLQKDWVDYFGLRSGSLIRYHLKNGKSIQQIFDKFTSKLNS